MSGYPSASFSPIAIGASYITYLLTRLRMERASAERARALAEAVAALENEKEKFEQAARGIEENARRKALDEFLADLRVEERRYVREHRVLFAHRKSLVLQERIFFRNIPDLELGRTRGPESKRAPISMGWRRPSASSTRSKAERRRRNPGRKLSFRAG